MSGSAAGILVGGDWQQAPRTFARADPSRPDREAGRFSAASAAEVVDAYAAAAEAAAGWRRTTAVARGEILRRAADLLEARADEAAVRLVADIGKAIRDARGEALRACAILRYHAAEATQPEGETYPSAADDTMVLTIADPVGVVCALTPWNFPLAIPAWKLAPRPGVRQPRGLEAGHRRLRIGRAAGRDPGRGRTARWACSTWSPGRAPSSRTRSPATRGWRR